MSIVPKSRIWDGYQMVSEGDGIVMHFTGLYDKGDEPVYECDIVLTPKGTFTVERSQDGHFVLANRYGIRSIEDELSELEVIGNAFEHPGKL